MNESKLHIILNPASAGGRTGARQRKILRMVERHAGTSYTLHVTSRPLDATAFTRSAVRGGADHVIAVGGDGTIQEVVNGLFDNGSPRNPDCTLGIISSGTGQGLAQSLRLPEDIEEQVSVACCGTPRRVDIGRISLGNGNGKRPVRYFVNECQLGIGAHVVQSVSTRFKRFGGFLAFGWKTLIAAIGENAHSFVLSIDDAPEIVVPLLGLIIANGAYTGGGMHIAPSARLDDGAMDILMIHDQTVRARLRSFLKVYSGKHLESGTFTCTRARKITIGPAADVPLAADGELLGTVPCGIELLPRTLLVRTPE